jgi:hypothetical protein
MLRSKFALQLTHAKRLAVAVPPEYLFEFSTSRQTRGCRVSLSRIGWTKPHSRTSVSRSAAAEINSGRALFAFLKGGPAAALSLYSDPTNSITTPGTAIRRVR